MFVATELRKGLEMASEADLHTERVPQGDPVSNEGPDTEQGMAGARSPSKSWLQRPMRMHLSWK